jgi:Domain of unknown function (DUF5679)
MSDPRPGAPWTGNGYCIKCKEMREFTAVVSVVQSRLIVKGYCSYCGTKLNRILGAYLRPPERLPLVQCNNDHPHSGHRYSRRGLALYTAWCDGVAWPPKDYPLTDIRAAYEKTIKEEQADWDRVKARIIQIYGLTADDVARATGKFEPIPSVEDIARAYDGCDDPRCSWCKNPHPNG